MSESIAPTSWIEQRAAARLLGVDRSRVGQLVRAGRLRSRREMRGPVSVVLVLREDIDAYAAERRDRAARALVAASTSPGSAS